MATVSAIEARNRANAQHSTGPRTDEGKRRSAQNALKLGLFVADGTLEQEDPEDLAELFAAYTAEYCPRGICEEELVRQIVMATHRLRRLERIETGILYTDRVPHTRFEGDVIMSDRFAGAYSLDRLLRARAQAERAFARAYKELEKRKDARWFPREPPTNLQIEANLKHASIEPTTYAHTNEPTPVPDTRQCEVGQALPPAVTESDPPAIDIKPGALQNDPKTPPDEAAA